ncbi:N-terminal EF-hand calcium-binding protein 1 [Latimeria chalumnae]|uniref:N-terminal EF-hand calcium-binding protein 1 n=1 Tax=Latimeria chalumnae TaxID=7897 RepID=UPI00313CDC2D
MLACTKMLTLCLQPGKHAENLNSRHRPFNSTKGFSIFHDIFRRADKNDDGKLSFDEFKTYFADGILGSDELQELFNRIDQNHTENVDTEQLCEYFAGHLGEYKSVLSALESLNVAILTAMDKTKLEYESSPKLDQFVTRFLLRETVSQLQSLQGSLECAMDAIEEQTCQEGNKPEMKNPEVLCVQKPSRRCGRKAQKSICLSPTDPYSGILTSGICVEPDSPWISQIDRLQQLLDKLESKSPGLEPVREEVVKDNCRASYLLVAQRRISLMENGLGEFRQALKRYAVSTANQSGCLHVSVQKISTEPHFTMYELWQDRTLWQNHLQSNYSKAFQRSIIDYLESPEVITTMLLPASWWIVNNY